MILSWSIVQTVLSMSRELYRIGTTCMALTSHLYVSCMSIPPFQIYCYFNLQFHRFSKRFLINSAFCDLQSCISIFCPLSHVAPVLIWTVVHKCLKLILERYYMPQYTTGPLSKHSWHKNINGLFSK